MKKALIIGIGGQDGSYLADILLGKGYEVHGIHRRSSVDNLQRIAHIRDSITLHQGDLLDPLSLLFVIREGFDEIYNEADQDDVRWSQATPGYSYDVTFSGVGNLLHIIEEVCPKARIFQPVSATMFNGGYPQCETSPIGPDSPYACAKAGAYHLCRMYRQRGLDVRTGIMFNHDSPRRSGGYLLQRICRETLQLSRGEIDHMVLYDIDYMVDIGFAKEYMEAAHLIMQRYVADDYVIGTGMAYSIQDLVLHAFQVESVYKHQLKGRVLNGHALPLIADITKIKSIGWRPIICAKQLIEIILESYK